MADLKHNLLYDVTKLKAGEKVLDAFPVLLAFPVFTEHGADENNPWLLFTIFYADKGSALQPLPVDVKKQEALRLAGISKTDKRIPGVLAWEDEPVLEMVVEYIRLQDSLGYALDFSAREAAWHTISKFLTPIKKGDMDEAKEQTAHKTLNMNIEAMYAQVPKIEESWMKRYQNDERLQKAVQAKLLAQAGGVERRAAGQTFVPKK